MDYFTKISELNAKKAGLIEKANALIDKGELGGELEEVKNEIKSTQGEIEKVSEIAALSEKSAKKSENKQGSRPFTTLGEQLTAIRNAAKGQVDERLYAVNNDAKGANRQKGADGGYALQEDFAASILESAASSGEILSRVTSYTVGEGSSSVRWLRVDEDDISSSVCGGVRMYWAAEGYGVGASKPKFAETKLDLEKMMGYAYATDELLSDSVFMSSFFGRSFTLAAKRLLEDSIISGDGVGKPLGILSSPALVTVSKESEQSSGTITTENILKMWQRSLYDSRKRTVWLAHPDTEEQLQKLKFTDGSSLWLPEGGLADSPNQRILGRPVIYTDNCSSLGSAGDIILANLEDYTIIKKGTARQDWSMHVEFLTDQMCFRMILRVNGAPMVNKPLKIKNSTLTRSPFVTLAKRA